ncbi:histidinol-phosphate transaminase [Yersinia enterocolitica]|nr:histidinol-phosphate aminotransferase family protein [Yersinia enterocolitica]EKN6163935.1 histidinol-phosphate aminotransferase family protein [Yersinia enterocolitica]HDL7737975.1 histidinol-phosphate aminotransferase family protein [Yersinia enterocolitica]HDL8240475.1 histidinol-phosphate aminotransferase family protein [Yersinia enterocolitica]HDL8418491.1 histidinol-phosphate aminotransferase family protein [Yersinia enterocolitica]
MDRRTLLKSSGLLLGGLTLGSVIPSAQAKNSKTASQILIPSEQQPLLLNFNENSLGMSPKAHQVIIDALPTAFRYPDAAREQLITNIAAEYQLKTENISLGNGSSETIQAVIQAVIHQAERDNKPIQLVVPDPTFNYAELYAKPFGIPIEKVVLTKEMAFDLPAMQKKVADFNGRSIVYLCNPNNPTATITPADLITAWVKNATPETLFILDEAYAEFVNNPTFSSAISLVQAGHKNVLVTRTFSKIFALAGLRIGYGIAHPELISMVENFVSLDNTNTVGAVAALASLQDKPFVQYSRQSTDQARRIVTQALDQLNLAYLPSEANFVFHRVTGDVKTYQNHMKQYHVFVGREFPPAVGWNRLTLGTPEEMIAFVTVLKMFRTKGWV